MSEGKPKVAFSLYQPQLTSHIVWWACCCGWKILLHDESIVPGHRILGGRGAAVFTVGYGFAPCVFGKKILSC